MARSSRPLRVAAHSTGAPEPPVFWRQVARTGRSVTVLRSAAGRSGGLTRAPLSIPEE